MTKSTVYSSPPKYEFLIKTVEILVIDFKEGKTIKTVKKLENKNAEILNRIGSVRKGGKDAAYLELGLGLVKKIDGVYVVDRNLLEYVRQNKSKYFDLCLKKLDGYQAFYNFILTFDTPFTLDQLFESTDIINFLKRQGRSLNTESAKRWAIQGYINLGIDHGYIEELSKGRYRRNINNHKIKESQQTLDNVLYSQKQVYYKKITVGLAGTTFSFSLKRIDDKVREQLDEFDTKYKRITRKYDIIIHKDSDENWNIKLIKIR